MPAPSRLGKYEIRRELGKGSMGVVYEAFDPFIERRVAVKIIRQDQLGPSQTADLLARLKREAQAAGRLNHPGIVAIYDYGEDSTLGGSGVAYISMELIDGRELKDWFDEGRHFSQQDVVRIMGEVLSALQHAHERGVTHRDIKPSNVILLRNGSVKVADFGVARLDTSELTQAGTMIGTPMYMSPEQILGQPVDGRSDLFACGVMLYQFLTGEKPFTGSITTVMQKVLHHDPVPATQINADLSPAWDAVLHRALAKKPEDRFPSAAAMADAIAQAAHQQQDAVTVLLPRKPKGTGPVAEPAGPAATPRAPTLADSTAEAMSRALATATAATRVLPPTAPAGPPAASRAANAAAAAPAAGSHAPAPARRPVAFWLSVVAAVAAAVGLAAFLWPGRGPVPAAPDLARPASSAAPAASIRPASSLALPVAPRPVAEPDPARQAASPGVAPAAAMPRTATATAPTPTPAPASTAPAPPARAASRPPAAGPAPAASPGPAVALQAPGTPADAGLAAEWRQRVARLEAARNATTLVDALALLIGPLTAEERGTVTDFETQLRQRPPHTALVIGASEGVIRASWQTRAPTSVRAVEIAQRRCRELPASQCGPLFVNGDFRRETLVAVARELGAQPPAAVRARTMRAFERALADWRQIDTASLQRAPGGALPGPAPGASTGGRPEPAPGAGGTAAARTPPAAGPAEPPRGEPRADTASDWPAQALAQMRAGDPKASFARSFAVLLRVSSPDEREQLQRLQSAFERLRWYSAVAFGEKNGLLVFRYTHLERNAAWAQDGALAECGRAAGSPCVLLMADGSFRSGAVAELALRLGSQPQTAVRENFMRLVRRVLQSGL